MFGSFFRPPGGARFEEMYRCFPVSFLGRSEAEQGDKVFLPPSALDRLAQLHIEYPMLFEISLAGGTGRTSHCGVLEFVADEGMVFLPYWMMLGLGAEEGDLVSLKSASLPKASFVKLRPHTSDFLDISDPRAVLETTLRSFSCLTVGDAFPIRYNDRTYVVDVLEVRPGTAVSIIETDCEVDFAPPLDYDSEAERAKARAASAQSAALSTAASLPRTASTGPSTRPGSAEAGAAGDDAAQPEPEPAFVPFKGSGRRLDGKAAKPVAATDAGGPQAAQTPAAAAAARAAGAAGAASSSATAAAGAAQGGARKKAGKIMFKDRLAAKFAKPGAPGAGGAAAGAGGAGAGAGAAAAGAEAGKGEGEDKDAGGFKAFQGKGHSLRG